MISVVKCEREGPGPLEITEGAWTCRVVGTRAVLGGAEAIGVGRGVAELGAAHAGKGRMGWDDGVRGVAAEDALTNETAAGGVKVEEAHVRPAHTHGLVGRAVEEREPQLEAREVGCEGARGAQADAAKAALGLVHRAISSWVVRVRRRQVGDFER